MKGETELGFVQIKLSVGDQIVFEVRNNLGEVDDMEKGRYGGIGLENVQRRLELIYPKAHELKVEKRQKEFFNKIDFIMIKCAIIDDEPLSRDVLRKFIQDHPDLILTAEYRDALETISGIEKQPVDLLLLDINMPKLSGVNFYKSLREKPLVIFTTAYPEFALEGFELDAVDYLMKPIAFDPFLQAIQKVKNRLKTSSEEMSEHIMLKVDKKLYRAAFDDILYLEAFGDYAKVYLLSQVLIITSTMKRLEAELPSELFVRTHKSFIINISKVEFIEGNQVKIGSEMIPIGLRYREAVLGKLR